MSLSFAWCPWTLLLSCLRHFHSLYLPYSHLYSVLWPEPSVGSHFGSHRVPYFCTQGHVTDQTLRSHWWTNYSSIDLLATNGYFLQHFSCGCDFCCDDIQRFEFNHKRTILLQFHVLSRKDSCNYQFHCCNYHPQSQWSEFTHVIR